MRIIAGAGRGRSLKSVPKELMVKPISARIKKSVFDILRPRLEGSRFLDLYAGTGAVGLEALSRGAASCFFVDADKRCVAVIEENLKRLGFAAKGRASFGDILQDLSWVGYRAGNSEFDIVFLGPPYRTEENVMLAYSTPSLARVAEAALLAPGGIILLQRYKKEKVELPAGYEKYREERYGDTDVEFIRRSVPAA
ncbi:MAG: 16S rRNA (guanine(966)-N(2))-methyltransferase RsmD [Elusimicrobiota bacterium]|nr:MAG: 16S rRNA (guanine(966)-N(2))-methyltransferase RsmD [Elusimicrobiota bacterium]